MSVSGRRRILLADDDDAIRAMLRGYLVKKGYEVVAVSNGLDALARVADEPFDLVVLDVNMPGPGGVEVLARIKGSLESAHIPVIMATAQSHKDDIVRALELGADDYVTKPFDFSVLMARIEARLRPPKRPRSQEGAPLEGVGALLDDRYRLEAELGRGAHGVVYRARHVALESPCAVKVLDAAAGDVDAASRERFRREGVSACRVVHPNAVRVSDFGVDFSGAPYLVMELLDGPTVEAELAQTSRVSLERAVQVMAPVAAVLAEAHASGIIHRDIKPANVLLHRGAKGEIVKVLDFGVAKIVDDDRPERVQGSPAYMSPERLRGAAYDGRADVYSVGVMFFEMLVGGAPFVSPTGDLREVARLQVKEQPPSVRVLRPDLDRGVETLCLRLLSKDPAERPRAAELVGELRRLLV
jgi:CheY-like chemotaxis protein